MTTTFQDVLEYIGTSATQEQVEAIFKAAKARHVTLRNVRAAVAAENFKIGDTVRTVNLKPKYLTGLTGPIVSREGDRFGVDLGDHQGKYKYGRIVRVPASCLVQA